MDHDQGSRGDMRREGLMRWCWGCDVGKGA